MYGTNLYHSWDNMKNRCSNESNSRYNRYGARGIQICDEWHDFKTFKDWALSNGYEYGLSIDRIDNDGNYCPENCRWVDRIVQANNKSNNRLITYKGITHTIAEWSRILMVEYCKLITRINRGDMSDFENYYGKENEE